MKRRTFLKILGGASLIGVVPKIVAKEEIETMVINGSTVPEYNGEYRIVATDKFSDKMVEGWGNICGVCRKPFETDEQLRKRILDKMKRT